MIVLQFFIFILALFVFVFSAYLCFLTFGAWIFKKITSQSTMPLSMAIVIPVHNEESMIKATLDSISLSEYQLSIVDTFVIADNCSDATVEVAKNNGAHVFERRDPENQGKGQALDWFFRKHETIYENFEAVVVLDAETVVDKHFLSQISSSLSNLEVEVVQGFYGVANPEASWRTRLSTAALNVSHYVRPAGRNAFGGSAGLKGNGMAFKPNILKRYNWPSSAVVEDHEFSTKLLLNDKIVHYNPEAIVLSEMSEKRGQAEEQGWGCEVARFQIIINYGLDLLKIFFRKKRFLYFDGFMELFIPSLTILFAAQITLLFLSCLFFHALIFDSILCLILTIFCVLSGMILCKASFSIWLALLGSPLYILWKLVCYTKSGCFQKAKQ